MLMLGSLACAGDHAQIVDPPPPPPHIDPPPRVFLDLFKFAPDTMTINVFFDGRPNLVAHMSDESDPVRRDIYWRSDDNSIAHVGADGTVYAHHVGTTQITAGLGGLVARLNVTVAPLYQLRITPGGGCTRVGRKQQFSIPQARKLTGRDTVYLEPGPIDWDTDKPEVAIVDSTGMMTPLSPGDVLVRGHARNWGITAVAGVTVMPRGKACM